MLSDRRRYWIDGRRLKFSQGFVYGHQEVEILYVALSLTMHKRHVIVDLTNHQGSITNK